MIRIWAKVVKEEKILKSVIYEEFDTFNVANFFDYVAEICNQLDIATPVILNKHLSHYTQFNISVFLPSDFPEPVNFDKLVLEEASNY